MEYIFSTKSELFVSTPYHSKILEISRISHCIHDLKYILKNRSLRFNEIMNENQSMTIDGSNQRFTYSFGLNTEQCVYWEVATNTWQSDGCLVDTELSTFNRIHCKCNHLSIFAVKYHKSDFCAVFPDKTTIAPMESVIWICIFFLLTFFAIMVLWAWRRDKLDDNYQQLIYLKKEHFHSPYYYAVTVVTGSRRNANTTSHVAIKIHGDQFTPQIIPLFDRRVQLFRRGCTDNFVVQTKQFLGRIEKITLCHDGHGPLPSWYCKAIIIRDLQRNEEWNFDVIRWFSREHKTSFRASKSCKKRNYLGSSEQSTSILWNSYFPNNRIPTYDCNTSKHCSALWNNVEQFKESPLKTENPNMGQV